MSLVNSSVTQSYPRQRGNAERWLQLLVWGLALVIVGWAWSDPRFRDPEGALRGAFCLPLAVSVALITIGAAFGRRLQRFAIWFALALVGQAAALQMIDAGPLIHYQHYRSLQQLLSSEYFLITAFVFLQAVVVTAAALAVWPAFASWIRCHLKRWQIVAFGALFILSSAAASRELAAYGTELVFGAAIQLVNLVNVVLMVRALPADTLEVLQFKFDRLFGRLGITSDGQPIRLDRFAAVAACWVIVISALLSYFVYENHPHVPDEVAYLMQARFLANGAVSLPAPPVHNAFDFYLMEFKPDQWYPSTPPGWPALLSIGVRLDMPWLVNPLLAGANVMLAYLLVRELYDRWTARVATLLLSASPWNLFMAMNFMTHTFTLTCALAAAVLVAWSRRTGNIIWAGLAGIMIGMGTIIRPLDGLIVGILLGLWAIGVGGRPLRLSAIAAFGCSALVVGACVLPFNAALTGTPTVFPLNAYLDEHFGPGRNDLGFGPNRGLGWALDAFPGHSPLEAVINASLNVFSLNVELFGWGTGSLFVLAALLLARTRNKSDGLMLAVIVTTIGAFSLYWYSGGPDFGARYWYLMLVPCTALAARGIDVLGQRVNAGSSGTNRGATYVMVAVLSLSALTLINYVPWRSLDKYYHYLLMRPGVEALAQTYQFGRSLVLIQGAESPDYPSAAIYNPLNLHADAPIFAWDYSAEVRAQVISAYADRPIWIVEGPTLTHGGYVVSKGPLSARDLLGQQH